VLPGGDVYFTKEREWERGEPALGKRRTVEKRRRKEKQSMSKRRKRGKRSPPRKISKHQRKERAFISPGRTTQCAEGRGEDVSLDGKE